MCIRSPSSQPPFLLRSLGLWSPLSQLQQEGHLGTMGVLCGGWGHSAVKSAWEATV